MTTTTTTTTTQTRITSTNHPQYRKCCIHSFCQVASSAFNNLNQHHDEKKELTNNNSNKNNNTRIQLPFHLKRLVIYLCLYIVNMYVHVLLTCAYNSNPHTHTYIYADVCVTQNAQQNLTLQFDLLAATLEENYRKKPVPGIEQKLKCIEVLHEQKLLD